MPRFIKRKGLKKKRDTLKQILTQKLTIIEEDVYQENPHIEYAPEIGEESEEAPPEEDLEPVAGHSRSIDPEPELESPEDQPVISDSQTPESPEDESPLSDSPAKSPDIDLTASDGPRTRYQSNLQNKNSRQSILNISRVCILWNKAFQEHNSLQAQSKGKKKCPGDFDMQLTQQVIVSSTYKIVCNLCSYKSEPHDMFLKKKSKAKGRPQSTLNWSVGMSLVQSRMGPSGFHDLLLIVGINPGSKRGLSKLFQQCCNTVHKLTKAKIKAQNRQLAIKFPEGINTATDGRYNNKYSSTLFQAGTQCLYTTVELNTKDKKIVNVQIVNQICIDGSRKIKAGEEPLCPNHPYCTADIARSTPISSEGVYAQSACEELKAQGLQVKSNTSDLDCAGVDKGIKAVFKDAVTLHDSIHVGKSHKRQIVGQEYSDQMFPGQNKKCISWFAEDLKKRCASEFTRAENLVGKVKKQTEEQKIQKMNDLLKDVPRAIVQCYVGLHRDCDRYSLVCSEKHRWEKKDLVTGMEDRLRMTSEDRDKVHQKILWRLGPDMVQKTYKNTNTQKCESVNAGYNKTCSKSITHGPVSFKGKSSATVLQRNEGFTSSSLACLSTGGHTVSDDIKKKMLDIDKEREYDKNRKKDPEIMKKRSDDQTAYKRYYEKVGACAPSNPYAPESALPKSKRSKR